MNIDEMLLNKPITPERFKAKIENGEYKHYLQSEWKNYCEVLERMRIIAKESKNPEVKKHLLLMLPEHFKIDD